MPICIEVSGDYACFSRPEMKVERVSYDVITPSAARGILEAVMWHPGMRYVIDIHGRRGLKCCRAVLAQIRDTVAAFTGGVD